MADWTLIQGAYQANKPLKPVAPGAITDIGGAIGEAAFNIGVSMEERGAQFDLLAKEIGEMDGLPEDAIDMFTADLDEKRRQYITGGPGERMKAFNHIEKRLGEAEEALTLIETLSSQSENLSDAYKKSSQGIADLLGLKEGLTIGPDGELGYYVDSVGYEDIVDDPDVDFNTPAEFPRPSSTTYDIDPGTPSLPADLPMGAEVSKQRRKIVKGKEFVSVKQMKDRFESNQKDDTFINEIQDIYKAQTDLAASVGQSFSRPFNRERVKQTISSLVQSTTNPQSLLMDRVGAIKPFQEGFQEMLENTNYSDLGINVDKDRDGKFSQKEIESMWMELMKPENQGILEEQLVDYYTYAIEKGYDSTMESRAKQKAKHKILIDNEGMSETIEMIDYFNNSDIEIDTSFTE